MVPNPAFSRRRRLRAQRRPIAPSTATPRARSATSGSTTRACSAISPRYTARAHAVLSRNDRSAVSRAASYTKAGGKTSGRRHSFRRSISGWLSAERRRASALLKRGAIRAPPAASRLAIPRRHNLRRLRRLRRALLLQRPHLRVAAVRARAVGVRAALDDAARASITRICVGVDDRGQPVRDDQRRRFCAICLQLAPGSPARGASRAPRWPRRRSGSAGSSAACARSRRAASRRPRASARARRPSSRSPPAGVSMKSWMCAARAAAIDFLAARAGAAVGDVVFDRVVEQHRVLRHDADRAAQRWPA